MARLTRNEPPYRAFSKIYGRISKSGSKEYLADRVRSMAADIGSAPVLDICCGSGALSFKLAEMGFLVDGVDKSHEMLAIAKSRSQLGTCRFFRKNILDFTPDCQYIAAVSSGYSLCYLNSHVQFSRLVTSIYENLVNGGFFIFDMLHPNSIEKHFSSRSNYVWPDYKFYRTIEMADAESGQYKLRYCIEDLISGEHFVEFHRGKAYSEEDMHDIFASSPFGTCKFEPFRDTAKYIVVAVKPS
jgi:SAM-dependent methyltransferase